MQKEMKVSPYEVEGDIDYDKLVKLFGAKRLTKKDLERIEKDAGSLHHYLKRDIVYSSRDLDKVLNEYEKGKKFFLYSGIGPSGPLHLGHIMSWKFILWLQKSFGVDFWVLLSDDEKYLYKDMSFNEIKKWTHENMLDIIAMGFDPKRTHFLIDTYHAGIIYPEAIKVAKKITFSTIKAAFGFNDSNNIGSIFYTAMQTTPLFLPNVLEKRKERCLIPFGIDQDPHFRISRDVVEKLGHKKPSILHWKFMSPLTGVTGKMSSSEKKAPVILMTDTPKEVNKKVNKYAFSGGQETIELHRKHGGDTEKDIAYQWLRYFLEDDKKLKKIHDEYISGKMLSGEIKKILIEAINKELLEHQKRRKNAHKLLDDFLYKKRA